MAVQLQERRRHARRDGSLDHPLHGARLGHAGGDEDDPPCAKNRRHPHRQRFLRHAVQSILEERRVGAARGRTKTRTMRLRDQRSRRLVESDMAVQTEAQNLQIDSSGSRDRAFVAAALPLHIASRAVQYVDAFALEVDAIEQMPMHECAVAARIGAA